MPARDTVQIDVIAKATSAIASIQKLQLAFQTAQKAAQALGKVMDFAERGGRIQQQADAFAALFANVSGGSAKMLADLTRASAGTITQFNLMQSASRAALLNIPLDKLPRLMEVARASSRGMGTTMTEAFNDIVTGTGRASAAILDNLGIRATGVMDDFATSIGKAVGDLTDLERQQAIVNRIMIEGDRIVESMGGSLEEMTEVERIYAMKAAFEDLNDLLAQKLLPTIQSVMTDLALTGAQILTELGRASTAAAAARLQAGGGLPGDVREVQTALDTRLAIIAREEKNIANTQRALDEGTWFGNIVQRRRTLIAESQRVIDRQRRLSWPLQFALEKVELRESFFGGGGPVTAAAIAAAGSADTGLTPDERYQAVYDVIKTFLPGPTEIQQIGSQIADLERKRDLFGSVEWPTGGRYEGEKDLAIREADRQLRVARARLIELEMNARPSWVQDPNLGRIDGHTYGADFLRTVTDGQASATSAMADAFEDLDDSSSSWKRTLTDGAITMGMTRIVDSAFLMAQAFASAGEDAQATEDALRQIVESIFGDIRRLALVAAVKAALDGKWKIAAILLGVAGVAAIGEGIMASRREARESASEIMPGTGGTGSGGVSAMSAMGMAGSAPTVTASPIVVHVHGSVITERQLRAAINTPGMPGHGGITYTIPTPVM